MLLYHFYQPENQGTSPLPIKNPQFPPKKTAWSHFLSGLFLFSFFVCFLIFWFHVHLNFCLERGVLGNRYELKTPITFSSFFQMSDTPMSIPQALAIDRSTNRIYCAFSSAIARLEPDGHGWLLQWSQSGPYPVRGMEFNHRQQTLLVVRGTEIQVLDLLGKCVQTIRPYGYRFSGVIAIDQDGDILVTDVFGWGSKGFYLNSNVVQVFSPNGEIKASFGTYHPGPCQLASKPCFIAVEPISTNIFIGGENKIQMFSPKYEKIRIFGENRRYVGIDFDRYAVLCLLQSAPFLAELTILGLEISFLVIMKRSNYFQIKGIV